MNVSCWRSKVGVCLLVCTISCGGDQEGATGIELGIVSAGGAATPTAVEVLWLDGREVLLKRRVPESGTLPDNQARAVTVWIEIDPGRTGDRIAVARGLRGAEVISEGIARVTIAAGQWVRAPIVLYAGRLPDDDGDGLPDEVARCRLQDASCAVVDASPPRVADAAAPPVDVAHDSAVVGDAADGATVPAVDRAADVLEASVDVPQMPDASTREAGGLDTGAGDATEVGGLNGLRGEYFDNPALTGSPTAIRIDPEVDFVWSAAPHPGLPSDRFSVRWTGFLLPRFSETYTLSLAVDDGARLYLDGVMIIDRWMTVAGREWSVDAPLSAQRAHEIKIEFREDGGSASCQFYWRSPSQAREIVPSQRLRTPQ